MNYSKRHPRPDFFRPEVEIAPFAFREFLGYHLRDGFGSIAFKAIVLIAIINARA
jgi:hypothetical protein